MGNSARLVESVEFADGVTREVRPLTIKLLRKFTKVVENLNIGGEDGTLKDADIDRMVDAAQIIMEGIDPKLAADRDKLEEALDVEVFWKIMQVAMGNKLADPNE